MTRAAPDASASRAGESRARRRLRGLGRGLVKAFLVITIASMTFNAVVVPPRHLSAPDGADVVVGRGGARTRVHYREWGSEGSPIVLVHGFAESTVSWSLTAPTLARHHRVYALDLAGSGYTGTTGRYGLQAQSDLVADFIAAEHLGRPVLVGHSLGAAVVGALALAHPEHVGGVIFADGDAMAFPGGGARGVMGVVTRTPYATSLYRLATGWNPLPRRIFEDQCGSACRGLRGPGGDQLVDAWMRPLRSRDAENAMWASARSPMLHLSPTQVRAISVPRGLVWGAQDATSGGSLEIARTNFSGAPEVIIPGAGHLSMVADPAAFATAVQTVMARMGVDGR